MAPRLAPARMSPWRSTPTRWVWLVVGAIAIVSCRPRPTSQAPPPDPAPAPSTSQPAPAATPSSPAPTAPAATLPNSLISQWQPLSNVLVAFGSMTITPDQVQWGSGQTSPYNLVSTEGGYLLELEASPAFYETQNQYIKLIPKADTNGAADSIEVAFYTDASQIQSDEYIMYGSYFRE